MTPMPVALRLMSACGLLVFLALAWLLSERRKDICWYTVATGTGLQIVLGVLVLRTAVGRHIFEAVQRGFVFVVAAYDAGAQFVFGPLARHPEPIFFVRITSTLIFISALMALLYYWKIMPRVVQAMAWVMHRVMRTGGRESLVAAANVFVGMIEAPLFVRPYLAEMTRSELAALMITGLATIAGSVMAVYVGFGINAGHLMTASVMSAPAALVIAKMIVPDAPGAERASLPYEARLHERAGSAFDAITTGARDGLFLALNVCAMLIAVVALIALLNAVLGVVSRWCHGPSLTLELLFGYVGWPFGLLMGVEPREAHSVGELLATKIFFTEFIAYKELAARASALTPRTVTIATYACCGFANFGSVAILIGGLSSLAPTRLQEVTQLALKALIGGALASFCTAAIAGMLL